MKLRNVLLLGAALVSLAGCGRVSPGNVGVEVTSWGSGAGVNPEPKGIGTYFTGLGTTINEYPVSTQTKVWTASTNEGGTAVNEEFQFNDINGVSSTADIGISYHIDPARAPWLYSHYRMDTDGLISGPIRNIVRTSLSDQAESLQIEDIIGPKKSQLITAVQKEVQDRMSKVFDNGIVVESVYWAGGPRPPQTIIDQINNKIRNQQAALAAEASVATATAEAQQKVATAMGDAKATQIKGDALRANPEMLKQQWIEKWDGHLPKMITGGNSSTLIQAPQ